MSKFEQLLADAVGKGPHQVHCVVIEAVGKDGKQLYSKAVGTQSLREDAPAISADNVFTIASCTKLITSIAALQCVERGLITLDEPVSRWLPELGKFDIIGGTPDALTYSKMPAGTAVTLRQLLTHSSGVGYDGLNPLLAAHRKSLGSDPISMTATIAQAFDQPFVFEPGQGWEYGGGLDWAGVLIGRLLGGTTLEEYFQQNIFAPLGMASTSFHIERRPELRASFAAACNRAEGDGSLAELPGLIYPDPPVDENGGHGLYSTPADYVKVLADIVSDEPKLLRKETIEGMLFKAQFADGSAAAKAQDTKRAVITPMAGKLAAGSINHGLGGMIVTEEGDLKDTLCWGGLANWVWFANRKKGIAALFATHMLPPGEPDSQKLEAAFIDEMFARFA